MTPSVNSNPTPRPVLLRKKSNRPEVSPRVTPLSRPLSHSQAQPGHSPGLSRTQKPTAFFRKQYDREKEKPATNPLPIDASDPKKLRHYYALAANGTEEIVAREIQELGGLHVRHQRGGVHFQADLETLYFCHRMVRTATRILLPVREFAALHAKMLYDQIHRMRWDELIAPEQTLSVECSLPRGHEELGTAQESGPSAPAEHALTRGPEPELRHSHYTALKIKDAIVDRIREKTGARPNIDTQNPDFKVVAHISRDHRCLLSLEATGYSLHERGYRSPGAEAPMKETLAAAVVAITDWKGEQPLIDPMCGSGTIVIEAALRALRYPLNAKPRRGCFMNWKEFDEASWLKAQEKVDALRKDSFPAKIYAYDSSSKALAQARRNASVAGVEKMIHFEQRTLQNFVTPPEITGPGLLITNPPYGERIGANRDLEELYSKLGEVLKKQLTGWTAYILSGNAELTQHIGLRSSRRYPLRNGTIECRLLQYVMH